jgi:kynureninase
MRQTALFVQLLDEAGLDLVSPREPERRGGSVVLRAPDFSAVHTELESRGILCDFRPDAGLRFGPHFFTTDEEIERAVSTIAEIVSRGAPLSAPAGRR